MKNLKSACSILFVVILAAFGIWKCSQGNSEANDDNRDAQETVAAYNECRANELSEEFFSFVALCEGKKGENRAYNCGARWTLPYGVTVYKDGRLVKKGDRCSLAEAKELSQFHVQHRIVPFLRYVTKKMSDEEILGTMLFIYNVGGEQFSGHDINGSRKAKPSCVLNAINAGKDGQYVANCMTRFRRSAGKRANGLLKARWVQGAVYNGILTSKNVQDLVPEKFYRTRNLGNYYKLDSRRRLVEKDGLYQLRYDEEIVNLFFKMNSPKGKELTVAQIMP